MARLFVRSADHSRRTKPELFDQLVNCAMDLQDHLNRLLIMASRLSRESQSSSRGQRSRSQDLSRLRSQCRRLLRDTRKMLAKVNRSR